MLAVPDPVNRYFAADARRDIDAIVAVFADDAVVVDESQTWRGTAELREWQLGPASKYEYTVQVGDVDALGAERYRVGARLEGNFPGATADVKFDFTIAGEFISRLEIAP